MKSAATTEQSGGAEEGEKRASCEGEMVAVAVDLLVGSWIDPISGPAAEEKAGGLRRGVGRQRGAQRGRAATLTN